MNRRNRVLIGVAIVVAILLLFCGGFFAGCHYKTCEPQPCTGECIQQITETQYNQALQEKEAWELKANAYASILAKWQLVLPPEEQILQKQFNTNKYFCEVWCPWLRDDLPKVKKDYQVSGCPSCSQPSQKRTRTRTCTDCDPPPPPPPPPPTPACTGPKCNPPPPPPKKVEGCQGPDCNQPKRTDNYYNIPRASGSPAPQGSGEPGGTQVHQREIGK